jgi:hypothetical protein
MTGAQLRPPPGSPPYPHIPPPTTTEKPDHIKWEDRADFMRIFFIIFFAVVISIILIQFTESFAFSLLIFAIFIGTSIGIIVAEFLDVTTSIVVLAVLGIIFYFFLT